MVGIFALVNGEPRSGFSMRCCDLRHNHSCQLAHYGFCPKPQSDMRRALYSLGSSHEGIVFVSSPEQVWEENIQLTLARVRESDWQTLSLLPLKPSLIEGKNVRGPFPQRGTWKFCWLRPTAEAENRKTTFIKNKCCNWAPFSLFL